MAFWTFNTTTEGWDTTDEFALNVSAGNPSGCLSGFFADAGTIVTFKLGDMTGSIPAFIRARHEYSGGYKYDIVVAVKMPDAWHTTRLYNIEEKWLTVIR